MNDKHPVMLAYKETERHTFPLILIIGREPNNNTGSESEDRIGSIPFKEKGTRIRNGKEEKYNNAYCSFWNNSFGILAKQKGIKTSAIKKEFEERKACPIIFSDASPNAISNDFFNKDSERKKVNADKVKDQLNKIFNQKHLLLRVRLVIFSGLGNDHYKDFKDEFKSRSKNIYSFEINESVPFFYGTNSRGINDAILKNEDILKEVYDEFIKLPILN